MRTYYPDVLRWEYADWVIIDGKDEVTGIDLSLKQGSTVSGRVVDAETGQPISGLEIHNKMTDGSENAWTDTDFNGAYTLWGIPEGIQEIIVRGRGYIEERRDLEVVERSQIQDFDFNLIVGGSVSGTVTDQDTGFALPNIEVHAAVSGSDRHVAWERTDTQGRFTLSGLAPGEIQVFVEGQGYIPRALTVVVSGQETVTGADLDLNPGATITGIVTDISTGDPIVGAQVRQHWEEAEYESDTRTDGQGRYMLTGLGEGHHRIWVQFEDQNYIQEYYNRAFDWNSADLVAVKGREEVGNIDFSLTRGAVISGRVADGLTGKPIVGMDVEARLDGNGISYATSNRDGNYILRSVPDGLVEVVVRGQGYIEQRQSIRVSDGQDVTGVDF